MSARWIELLVTVVCSVIASSGFWAFVQNRRSKKDASHRMLLGLGHDRIMTLGLQYIERGWITKDEYEDLLKYLYKPYLEMGGDGSAQRIMQEVERLPIRNRPTGD